MKMNQPVAASVHSPPAWWQVGMLWLVLGGPAVVVLASFATLALAIAHPDPLTESPAATSASQLPAVQARNHAATARP
jgi:uncharacterized protein